jgi:predicted RNase H-like HicB family nuclease
MMPHMPLDFTSFEEHDVNVMKRTTLHLTAVIYPDADSDWLVAHNPETGTTTQGKTFEEALANLEEATELYLSEFPLAAKGRAVMTTFEVSSPTHG